ncbi:MAG: phosphoribosylformylglycinamidine synthase subunit PurS [Flavobacteriales bacterium]
MTFIAEIDVMPHKALLDPQGKAVSSSMKNIGLPQIGNVRIGKHIQLEVNAESKEAAIEMVEEACKKLLANPIMEYYSFEIAELQPVVSA